MGMPEKLHREDSEETESILLLPARQRWQNLNSDVSAFLELQGHSPGSTSQLKRIFHSIKGLQTKFACFGLTLHNTRLNTDTE